MQHLPCTMSDIQWQPIEIDEKENDKIIEHNLDFTAAELHSHFISSSNSDSTAISNHEKFLQSTSEVVERTRQADSQIFAQSLMGASLDAKPMIDGVSITTLGIPSECLEVKIGIQSGTSYLRIDRLGLEPVVSVLPTGRKVLSARHTKGRLEIRLTE